MPVFRCLHLTLNPKCGQVLFLGYTHAARYALLTCHSVLWSMSVSSLDLFLRLPNQDRVPPFTFLYSALPFLLVSSRRRKHKACRLSDPLLNHNLSRNHNHSQLPSM